MTLDVLATLRGALRDRYAVERELGEGGMAHVFAAHDLQLQRRVAIKVLKPQLMQTVGVERFLREIAIEARLQHPNILQLYDRGSANGLVYYVMQFVDGETLRQRLQREAQLPIDEAVHITRQIGDALDCAHSHGVIHRDIKPENILLSGDRAFVADFGIARAMSAAGGAWQTDAGTTVWQTATGIVLGTLGYMSPEQAMGDRHLDGRSDEYALACVTYEMLAGETPFSGATLDALLRKMLSSPVPSVRIVREQVSGSMEGALNRALARTPADRFRTCGRFVAALERDVTWRDRALDYLRTPAGAIGLGAVAVAIAMLMIPRDRRGSVTEPDTTRYVIFPFEHEDGASFPLAETRRLNDAFNRWSGLRVLEPRVVEAALSEDGVPGTQTQAATLARNLGAGRYVRISVSALGDSLRVDATLYDATARGPPLADHTIRLSRDLMDVDSAFGLLASNLLFRGEPPEHVPGPNTTRSLPAAQRFAGGLDALQEWNLVVADSSFEAAVKFDASYAQAHLWLALIRAWSGAESGRWRIAASQAALGRERLSSPQQLMAEAVLAQARGELAEACGVWQRLTRHASRDFAAWYGLAYCLRKDNAVLRDPTSPSGWRFRSSYSQAIRAYRRAFELHPAILSSFRRDAYGAVRTILMTANVRVMHLGRAVPPDTLTFLARPHWTDDSLVLVPYPVAIATRARSPWDPRLVTLAVRQQRQLFHDIVLNWATTFPQSAVAMEALAVSLEALGDPAALDTIRRARALAAAPEEQVRAASMEVWMLVKLGQLRRAKALGDSTLSLYSADSPLPLEELIGLAALTGRAETAVALARRSALQRGTPPAPLAHSAPALLVLASLGGPVDSLRSLEEQVTRGLEHGSLTGREILTREWLARSARLAAPVFRFRSINQLRGKGDYLIDGLTAWAEGDTQAVRRMFVELDASRRRSVPPAERAFDALYPEATLLTWLHDDRNAIAWLDPTLHALPEVAPGTFSDPALAGALVNTMALRAELAARTGDQAGARRWAEAVMVLWADADSFLQPLVARMKRLASG